jgi:hypothetical protein
MAEASIMGRLLQILDRPGVDTLIDLLAVGVAIFTIWNASRSLRRQLRNINYTEIDRLYFDLLSLKLTCQPNSGPDKRTRTKTFNDTYSLLLWNFIESIVDRCQVKRHVKGDSELFETWKPIIMFEGANNIDWFCENRAKFKESFREWVDKTFQPACAETSQVQGSSPEPLPP